ncbi:hypothetical protein Tco_0854699 [Tanacetum coccineum]
MNTEIPQSSGPTEHVADEAVHKERGVSLVRAATTTSSLKAEQDNGNITKTQSKATLNEPSSPGTSSGSGPRCQETMGDTIAQTWFENVSKHSNDPLLARAKNIVSLKRRVKKLEQKKRLRTHGLKRLRRVGATARVDSSEEEEVLGEDASKQGRSDNVDTLFSGQDEEMLNDGKEVVVVEEINERRNVVNEVAEVIKIAQVSAASEKVSTASATTTTTTTEDDLTLAQALADLKSTKLKAKGIAFREPEIVKKDQLKLDDEITLKLQAEIDEEERIARVEEEKIDEANISWDDIQAKVDADYQLAERLQAKEQEQFTIEQKATLFKELLE